MLIHCGEYWINYIGKTALKATGFDAGKYVAK